MSNASPPAKLKNWGKSRVISLRLIATLAVAGLVAGSMLALARVNEQYTRKTLQEEAESRILLEARNLALLSQDALLSEFPELTLVPLITDLRQAQPEMSYVIVVDHQGTIVGSSDPREVGEPFQPLDNLTSRSSENGQVMENGELRLAESMIERSGEQSLGRAIVGIQKGALEKKVRQARKDLFTFAAILLPVAMGLAALLMTLLLRPIPAIRKGLERIGQGDLDSPIKIKDPTELGVLARSINEMADQLKSSQSLIQDREMEIVATQKEVIHTLGDVVESRSSETANHTLRVAAMSMKLAEFAGLPIKEANLLRMASPMHDVGKIGIPDSILNKPGKLTKDEFEVMKTHSEIGYTILAKSDRKILKAAAIIAHEHHERWDGNGYPQGLAGTDIHIFGRIVSLVDVFDAVYSDRVYRPAMELDQVLEIIREGRGTHFQPELVDHFLNNLHTFLDIHGKFNEVRHQDDVPVPPAKEPVTREVVHS